MHNLIVSRKKTAMLGLLCCALLSAGVGRAQDLKPLRLLFVDAYGKPIAGVAANPGSLVYQGNTGASFMTRNLKTPDGGELVSDELGAIEIPVPDKNLGELYRFKLNAKHYSYAEFTDWVTVNIGGVTEIELARGVRIAATAMEEETVHPVKRGLFAIAEQQDLDQLVDWKSNGNGLLLSRRLRVSDRRIRLVQILDGNAVRFSDAIDVEKADGERTFVRDVIMRKALLLSGRLEDSIPRPIRNGLISVCIAWPTETEREEYGPAGHWLAHSEIDEGGTFRVQGLPAGSWIQVIASCDGWFNKHSDLETRMSAYPGENRLFNIEDSILPVLSEFNSSLTDIVLEMQPTVAARIECVDTNAQPIVRTKVFANRSQRFFGASWFSRDFRAQLSTCDELRAVRAGNRYQPPRITQIPALTDDQGVARINVPGARFSFRVDGYSRGKFAWSPIELTSQGDAKVIVNQ